MNHKITIGIPTYNRENQLRHQLQCIIKQDLTFVEEIIIVDNHSNYDIVNSISELNCTKLRLITNPFNIKMATNMEMPFLYCKTEWLWLLSDDDEVLPDSINTITDEIRNCHTDIGMIKFAIDRQSSIQRDYYAKSLEDYIDYYYNENIVRRGDLVFLSTCVLNMGKIRNHLGSAFEFSYSYLGFMMPVFFSLNENKIAVKFSSKPVVIFIPPREGWYSFGVVGKGLSTLSHLPLNLSNIYWRRFLNITMSITYIAQISACIKTQDKKTIRDFRIIYNNIYRYYLPNYTKVLIWLFFQLMSIRIGRAMLNSLKTILKKLKR